MRKITCWLMLLAAMALHAQDFPGSKPELLVGKEVKVVHIEGADKTGYCNFFSDSGLTKTYLSESNPNVPYKMLLGKKFKVVNAENYLTDLNRPATKLVLNDENGETVYYRYLQADENVYPFQVEGGFDAPSDLYCDYLKPVGDRLGTTLYEMQEAQGSITIGQKVDSGSDIYYTMGLTINGDHPAKNPKGATVVLSDGTTIDFPDQPVMRESQTSKRNFKYSTTLRLSRQQMDMLRKNRITDIKLDEFKKKIYVGRRIQGAVTCLMNPPQ